MKHVPFILAGISFIFSTAAHYSVYNLLGPVWFFIYYIPAVACAYTLSVYDLSVVYLKLLYANNGITEDEKSSLFAKQLGYIRKLSFVIGLGGLLSMLGVAISITMSKSWGHFLSAFRAFGFNLVTASTKRVNRGA